MPQSRKVRSDYREIGVPRRVYDIDFRTWAQRTEVFLGQECNSAFPASRRGSKSMTRSANCFDCAEHSGLTEAF